MASPEALKLKQQLADFSVQLSGRGVAPPTLSEIRDRFAAFADIPEIPVGVRWTEVDAGGVPAIWATADGGANDRVIQYLHGGGYLAGNAKIYQHFTGHLAKATGCRVLSVDYRLAPECPYPAAMTDSVIAYNWLLKQGHEPSHLAMAGDSAGAGLAISTVQMLRSASVPVPAALVLISPWVDLEATGESMATNAQYDVMLQRPALLGMAAAFLCGHNAQDPLIAPLHADLRGLPPLYVQVGGHETLLDDAVRIASVAREASVDVTLDVFPEMQHVFQSGVGRVPEASEAFTLIGAFVRSRLGLLGNV